jgi:hypothetical protein
MSPLTSALRGTLAAPPVKPLPPATLRHRRWRMDRERERERRRAVCLRVDERGRVWDDVME